MGNSIQKKKKKSALKEEDSPAVTWSPNREKATSFRLLRRVDKQTTAGPKGNEDQKRLTVHYTASQHYQENVFIEGSRSQYLEDLHTEAQEGLKILQQEEDKNGINFADDESISTDTLCPEQDISSKDRGGSLGSRPNTNNDSTATSAVLNQSGLTHQGSTFKPLNPVKRIDRSRKRNRRTTIMGIPNQVQKELALNRSSTFQPLVSTQLSNHENHNGDSQSSVVIIPTVDGGTPLAKKEGARVHLSELEVFRDEQVVRKHLQGGYQDEQAHLCPTSTVRPKSLAVPGMTTSFSLSPSMLHFLQEPQGPVMSISPQATYLSTIIPNAVLPASVEVIEIDRSNSRTRGSSINHGNSACTVSKSSLTSEESTVSPLLSRRSDGDGSQTNSSNYDSALMPRSASGSNWNESQSSKTIISDSSAASSNRGGFNIQESQTEESGDGQDLTSFCSSVNAISSLNKIEVNTTEAEYGHGATQSLTVGDQAKNKRNCIHSLSVTKTKHPPAPPRRTNSLHGKKVKSETMIVVDFEDLRSSGSGEVKSLSENIVAEDGVKLVATNASLSPEPLSNSSSTPLTPLKDSSNQAEEAAASQQESDPSSPQKTPSYGGKFERTMSPSSGYSSQSGTPTLSPKEISPNSPDKQKKKPIKPERSASRASSSAASPSSSLTSLSSGTSEPANADVTTCSTTLPLHDSSPTKEVTPSSKLLSLRAEVQELFNIPSPPKVKAPRPPPPETWAHSRRTVELLCGPCPNVIKTPLKGKQVETQKKPRKDTEVTVENQTNQENPVWEMSVHTGNPSIKDPEDGKSDLKFRESSDTEQIQKNENNDTDFKSRIEVSICVVKKPESQEMTPKKEPPPVMKKPMKIPFRDEIEQPLEAQERNLSCSAATELHLSVEDHTTPSQNAATPSQNAVIVHGDKSEIEKGEVQFMQTLTVDVPKMSKLSPPPTPPPAYQPTPPPIRKPVPSPVSQTPDESEKENTVSHVVDSSWPPPPPPLEGEPVFDGGDELDFPPPPPPSIRDDVTELTELTPIASVSPSADNKSLDDEQISKADTAHETSFQEISYVTDTVSPLPPLPPVTRAESPMLIQAVVPSSSYLKRNSLKAEDQCPSALPISPELSVPTSVPKEPPPPLENVTPGVNFRRQPSGAYRDPRNKELLSRHKSAPIPKEDANIPLVTPSLLQMVRLRTVSMTEDQVQLRSEDTAQEATPVLENCPISSQGPQDIPPKPIRKSLSAKSPPQTIKKSTVTMSSPSLRLQEAIRMKTAAMSYRDCLPHRLGVKSPTYGCTGEPGGQSLKPLEGCDMLKSPASTASFIFSRSTKKVVIEPVAVSSSEAQESLKQSLAAELKQVSDQSKAGVLSNGRVKSDRIPPPIAKKPTPGSTSPLMSSHSCSAKMELRVEGSKASGAAQPVGNHGLPKTTTRVTADTIETLF
ncbi:NHS-like protein 3 isoform 2-T2 [Anableps anableps]